MPRKSLTDKAYDQIKEWILDFSIKPGSHLSIGELAEALGISRTPVREALSRLEQKHMVVRMPMKGFTVKALDLEEIKDLFEVRTAVEILAARQAARRLSTESRAQIAESLDATAATIEKGFKSRSLDLEQNFHVKILEASGNIALAEIGRGVLERIWAIQRFGLVTFDEMYLAHEQHTGIFRAMIEGNSERAAFLMQEHMEHTTKFLMERLRDQTDAIHNVLAVKPTTVKLRAMDSARSITDDRR